MYKIKKASQDDAEGIMSVLESVLLENLSSKNKGFLTFNPGKEFYRSLIEKIDFFYVACKNGQVIGFLIAYPNSMLDPQDEIQKFIIDNFAKENFFYIFQVAVVPLHQSKGVGKKMYGVLFEDTRSFKKMVATSAVPYNQASEEFHFKLGFEKIKKLRRTDGGESFIYQRN